VHSVSSHCAAIAAAANMPRSHAARSNPSSTHAEIHARPGCTRDSLSAPTGHTFRCKTTPAPSSGSRSNQTLHSQTDMDTVLNSTNGSETTPYPDFRTIPQRADHPPTAKVSSSDWMPYLPARPTHDARVSAPPGNPATVHASPRQPVRRTLVATPDSATPETPPFPFQWATDLYRPADPEPDRRPTKPRLHFFEQPLEATRVAYRRQRRSARRDSGWSTEHYDATANR